MISHEEKMAVEGESQKRGAGMVLLTLRTLFSGSICTYVMSKTKQPLYSQPFNKNSNNCFKQWILHHNYNNVWSGYGGMFVPVLTTTKIQVIMQACIKRSSLYVHVITVCMCYNAIQIAKSKRAVC